VIQRYLPDFLVERAAAEPRQRGLATDGLDLQHEQLETLLSDLAIDTSVPPVEDRPGGRSAAWDRLEQFATGGLLGYGSGRTGSLAGSGLSAYLRFGQIAPLRAALTIQSADAPVEDRQAFLEQLIVRRELAANFVYYHPGYSTVSGIPEWARSTLASHSGDPRPFLYTRDELVAAATHDPVWNAAQCELLWSGRIQNQLRMYWGKKLIEWTADTATALAIGLELNDRFALDGRSANGFANLLWCFGRHDRPWPQRPIFGSVRSMTAAGLRRKLDLDAYVAGIERTRTTPATR
jgi:deoxyribodipyrimidine photo-lyase